ncbi:MAG: lamin tail domain-containing protein, partial [bacterium]
APANLDPDLAYIYELYPAYECASTFRCEIGNDHVSGAIGASDADGDDVADDVDNCPAVFNPNQGDLDADGAGDACDTCPWAVEECPCAVPAADDLDADGVGAEADNCPETNNPGQEDADGDGKGDVCDYCPESPDGGDQGCPATIPALKRLEIPIGVTVEVRGVVTAVVPASAPGQQPGSFFMESAPGEGVDPAAGWHGLYVYMGARADGVAVPAVGDHVEVVGVQNVYFGQVQVFEVGRVEVLDAAEPLAPPVEVTPTGLLARGAELEAQRVCTGPVVVTDIAPAPGGGDRPPTNEFVVTAADEESGVRVDDLLYLAEDIAPGDRFSAVCGVLRLANDNYKIEPRDADDLVPGPPVVESITPAVSFIRVGDEGVPAGLDGAPLEVVLSRPAPAGGIEVAVLVDDPALLALVEPLVIPEGADRAFLGFTALAEGEARISAVTADQEAPAEATVRVLALDAAPSALVIEPAELTLQLGEVALMRLSFDLPLAELTTVTITASADGVVFAPVELELDAGAASAEFEVEAIAAGEVTLTATAGELVAEATITVVDLPSDPILTEVNYDMAGNENLEFVEIHNPGGASAALAGVRIELVNGSNNQVYKRVELDGLIPAGGYLVVGDAAVEARMAAGGRFVAWASANDQHDIQNGDPDGVRLMRGDTRLDGVVYARGSIPSVTDEPAAPDDPNDGADQAIGRCPSAAGAPWLLLPMSPGARNTCP